VQSFGQGKMSAFHVHLHKGRELVIRNPVSASDATIRSCGLLNCDRHRLLLMLLTLALACGVAHASALQKNKTAPNPAPPLIKRTSTRQEVRRMGYGGTVTVVGAPVGSIVIEGWSKSEVEITAEIELNAPTEADFERLGAVNNYFLDSDVNHLKILTTGMHDKPFMRRVAKDFPKALLGLPWRIDYHLRVPASTDLEIHAGSGTVSLKGVDGAIVFTSPQSEATLTLLGGLFRSVVALGKINVTIPSRSWRGSGVDIQLAAGDLTVELPPGFSGDIDASVLRSGRISNGYVGLEALDGTVMNERVVHARAGVGGASLRFIVGDGTISIKKKTEE
jgi:hypothetical protein